MSLNHTNVSFTFNDVEESLAGMSGLVFLACVSNGGIAPPSVRIVEGTVTSLLDDDGCVTGLQYRDKETGDVKVRNAAMSEGLFCSMNPRKVFVMPV